METEIGMYQDSVDGSLEMIMDCFEGLDGEAIRWQPLATANCLAVIAKHSLANAHRNVLAHFGGEPYDYHRDEEFVLEHEDVASLISTWEALRERMRGCLNTMPKSSLDAICNHARMGPVSGRVVLLQAARHAAEHAGEARLTRHLIDARSGR